MATKMQQQQQEAKIQARPRVRYKVIKAKKGKFGAIKVPKKLSNFAGGGSAQRGFGRAFLKGGKV